MTSRVFGNARDVFVVVRDRDDQRCRGFEQLPAAVGLSLHLDLARFGGRCERFGKRNARNALALRPAVRPVCPRPNRRTRVPRAPRRRRRFANAGGQGAGDKRGSAILDRRLDEHGVVGPQRERFSQDFFRSFVAAGDDRDLAAVSLTYLQGRLERSFRKKCW